jgi:lysyl-tRNA synthetase class 2
MDPEVLKRFQLRSALVKSIRNYLDSQNYIEIETPALQNLYGGTNARPFKTHLNSLDIDMYLRIAVELYLKRAIVGGFDRVFEIAKDFRNEGMDQSHSPEFTMLELYEAYANYHRIMELTEGMIKFCAQSLFQKEEIVVQGQKISLSGQWPKITMSNLVKEKTGLDFDLNTQEDFFSYAKEHKLDVSPDQSKGMLMYTIFDHQITKNLTTPVWVIDYPIEVSPLAKQHPTKPGFVERFEGYIGGIELCDGWSEINDPIDQRNRFENEQKAMRQGKKRRCPPG